MAPAILVSMGAENVYYLNQCWVIVNWAITYKLQSICILKNLSSRRISNSPKTILQNPKSAFEIWQNVFIYTFPSHYTHLIFCRHKWVYSKPVLVAHLGISREMTGVWSHHARDNTDYKCRFHIGNATNKVLRTMLGLISRHFRKTE